MSYCCCILAGTSACRYCANNPYAEPATAICTVQTDTKMPDFPLFKERAEKPKTNADKLRSMTDEELAEWLDFRLSECPWCNPNAPVKPGTNECELYDCQKCALDWLRREAECEE